MENTIEITREKFREKMAKIISKSSRKEDNPDFVLAKFLVGIQIMQDIEEELFGKEKEEMN